MKTTQEWMDEIDALYQKRRKNNESMPLSGAVAEVIPKIQQDAANDERKRAQLVLTAAALQGLIASPRTLNSKSDINQFDYAQAAVAFADATLAEMMKAK